MAKNNTEKKDTKKKLFVALILFMLLFGVLWGVLGSLTDIDQNYDVYTIGNVEIKIVSNDGNSSLGNLLPNSTVPYGIAAKNVGINDAYVFMTITVPCENAIWTNENGVSMEKNLTQILSYYSNTAGITSEWKLVDVGCVGEDEILDVSHIQNNTADYGVVSGNTITFVYGYIGDNEDGALEALKPDYTTSSLIDYLKLANVNNPASLSGEITTKLYGIQVTKLDGGLDEVDAVWDIINDAVVKER